jgi:hypothetical protein
MAAGRSSAGATARRGRRFVTILIKRIMKTKVCFKCNIEKPLTYYYKHGQMGDGHLNKCIDCTKKDNEKRLKEKLKDPLFCEKEASRHREKYHRLYVGKHKPTKESKKVITNRYKQRFPEKVDIKGISARLRKEFSIIDSSVQLHHWSYKPEHLTDIITLSKSNHYLIHRFIKYNQNEKVYETLSGELLDSKQKHIDFIKSIILNKSIAA